ncbi:hypothetical protein BpHYR1_006073 [Brachionus plicatilis]|uniref:Uncharacterized protein n=1 Tax=Brachionus plicatilis TaxID=10195 RepID=A0A3M7RDQ6_BRAPC|nr:hypothetical protein BpHYR1_006073 [Brachionus plicatilis]
MVGDKWHINTILTAIEKIDYFFLLSKSGYFRYFSIIFMWPLELRIRLPHQNYQETKIYSGDLTLGFLNKT